MDELETKIYNGEELTEDELREFVQEYSAVYEVKGDEGRWTVQITSIFQINDKLFAIDWDRGLTELQESEFYCQPYEVVKKTETKTIEFVSYAKKGK